MGLTMKMCEHFALWESGIVMQIVSKGILLFISLLIYLTLEGVIHRIMVIKLWRLNLSTRVNAIAWWIGRWPIMLNCFSVFEVSGITKKSPQLWLLLGCWGQQSSYITLKPLPGNKVVVTCWKWLEFCPQRDKNLSCRDFTFIVIICINNGLICCEVGHQLING